MAKTFKVLGETYELISSVNEAPEGYALNNELYDDPPGGKFIGYVILEDGSVIQCFKKTNPLNILLPIILIVALVGVVTFYFLKVQPKDVSIGDNTVKEGADSDVISYNSFTTFSEEVVDVQFINGDEPATIVIKGDGIKSEPISVQPHETVDVVPVVCDTDKSLVDATLTITTPTSTFNEIIMVELPENETLNSPSSGLDNYWRGETVYGHTSAGEPTVNTVDDVQTTEQP